MPTPVSIGNARPIAGLSMSAFMLPPTGEEGGLGKDSLPLSARFFGSKAFSEPMAEWRCRIQPVSACWNRPDFSR